MEPWHLEDTYRLVKAAFGADQEGLARESTRSIPDRQAFASYHYTEALRLTRDFERRHLSSRLLIDLHGQDGKRKRVAFDRYILKAGAHATAAVQSIHAIPDILANAVYFATGQNLKPRPFEDRKINPRSVASRLKHDDRFQSLVPLLTDTQSGDLWRHLAAVANLSKHRTVVRSSLNEDMTGTRKNFRELHFRPCEYNGDHFPSLSLQALLEPEHYRLSIAVLTLGHELNACLQRDPARSLP